MKIGGEPARLESGGCHGGEFGGYSEDAVEFAISEGGGDCCRGSGKDSSWQSA